MAIIQVRGPNGPVLVDSTTGQPVATTQPVGGRVPVTQNPYQPPPPSSYTTPTNSNPSTASAPTIAGTGQNPYAPPPGVTAPYGNANYVTPAGAVYDPAVGYGINQNLNWQGILNPAATFAAEGANSTGGAVTANNGIFGKANFNPVTGQNQYSAMPNDTYANDPGAWAGSNQSANPVGAGAGQLALMASLPGQAGQWAQQQLAQTGTMSTMNTAQNDPTQASALQALMYGTDPQTIINNLNASMNGGAGNVTLPWLQQMQQLITSSGATTGANAYGQTAAFPAVSAPASANPATSGTPAQTGTINPTTQQQIASNYMSSPQYNPYGTNTWAIQNTDTPTLQSAQPSNMYATNSNGTYQSPNPYVGYTDPTAAAGSTQSMTSTVPTGTSVTSDPNPANTATASNTTTSPAVNQSNPYVSTPAVAPTTPAQTTGGQPAQASSFSGYGPNSITSNGMTAAQAFQQQQQNG